MRGKYALSLMLLAWAMTIASVKAAGGTRQNAARVPMSSFKNLYFKDGHKTMSRRNEKYPQLVCTGNSKHICNTYAPDIVLCRHLGDGAWKCEADLHHSVRFGNVDVSCEGWDGPEDEFVLRGSCMLKYTLLPNYPDSAAGRSDGGRSSGGGSMNEFYIFLAIIAAMFVYFWYKGQADNQHANRGARRGGRGGGGGGGDGRPPNDPPPPYRPYPKQEPGTSNAGPTTNGSSTSTAWQPGFWTGLAGGALASEAARYMRGENRTRYAEPRPRGFFGGSRFDDDDARGGGGGGGGWFGGNTYGAAGPSRSSRDGSPGETRTAFGYGGSSVR